ncbi:MULTISPECIES: hypothetical protein [Halorussus]|uniref:hypothetical protein n=1 Tax=Halorussus TaxID=1070314 RepID=UPI000E2111C5|nr:MULTISPECIES: hypothetical protein [Halorussus]NHN61191.1 hypothetical protein [Halorussus sp. JP-T4]
MPLRPTDTDLLADICTSVALRNYGFLYVDRVNDEIRSQYESADKSPLKASSLSQTEIKKAMDDVVADEYSELQRLRTGVYYYDPFGTGDDEGVATELTTLFRQQLVVTSEELRSRFDLAIDDIDFFADELADRNLVRRIATGERDYYTIGSRLKEQAGEAGVDARLREKATYGKLAHDQLEKVINVSATADVIRYLEAEEFVIDLDGEYLVESAIPRFGEYLADRIADDVETEFENSGYVLPEPEFGQVVENEIDERSDVLAQARAVRGDILDATEKALTDELGLDADGPVVRQTEAFESYVDRRAEEIHREVTESGERLATESDFREVGHPLVEEVHVGTAQQANEYARDAIRERFDERVTEEFRVEPSDS